MSRVCCVKKCSTGVTETIVDRALFESPKKKIRWDFVDTILCRIFYQIGLWVGKRPGYFIIVPALLALTCMTGYQKLVYENDPEYLFSPIDGPSKYERAVVEEHFRMNYSSYFSIERITRPGRFGHIIIVSKDQDENILRGEAFRELKILDDMITNATLEYDSQSFTFKDICARWENECSSNKILDLDEILNKPDIYGIESINFPVMFSPIDFKPIIFPVHFGGTKVYENSTIESVPAVQLAYFIAVDTERQKTLGSIWEDKFLELISKVEKDNTFKHISIARYASKSLELELEKNTQTIKPFYVTTFLLMGVFSVITCMMTDSVESKPYLGLIGNISASTATVSAFGLCMYCGVKFIGLNLAAPFLMISIGIDDTFVMLAAWRKTNVMNPVPIRMAETLREAAVSISITSLTDMISLFTGIISPFPSVQIFCIYSGFAVVFTFIFHVTFFSGFLALSGYCEEKNLHSITFCKVEPLSKSTHRSFFYRWFCAGGTDRENPENPIDNPDNTCMSWFRDTLGDCLNKPLVKTLVLVIFSLYLSGAIYGFGQLKEGLDRRKLSKADSYTIEFYDREDKYFHEYPYRIQVVVSGQYDYSDPAVQDKVENLLVNLENTQWIARDQIYSTSWLRSFTSQDGYVAYDNEEDFINGVKSHYNQTVIDHPFSLDIHYDESGKHIIGSRYLIQARNVTGTLQQTAMLNELRQICKNSGLNATVFHPYFIFVDQFDLVLPTSYQNMIWGAITMMGVSFFFIPNLLCSFWIAFCIISIELGVVGYMALWNVNLDSISMINLVMCLGFSVDFTAHICYAYMSCKKKRPDEKLKEALYSLGLPIVQGALSTIFGLLALLLAGTYIFLVFFKMVFLVIAIGAIHGLIILPVLLTIFGPGSYTNHNKVEEKKARKDIEDNIYCDYVHKLPKYEIPHPKLLSYQNFELQESPMPSIQGFDDSDYSIGTDENSSENGSPGNSTRMNQIENEKNSKNYDGWSEPISVIPLSEFSVREIQLPDYPVTGLNNQTRALRSSQQLGYHY
ncbi:patched domain-containing protein 3-like [Aphidius gifuensis]|uniref:patched domain-containing protein 3-like n=1 Tax=Aphidius gifuensis TaxID=684658 RepID=UPI001CDCBFF7|nr:patched domain-containing protein 3-like [Aphidius gifuensis]